MKRLDEEDDKGGEWAERPPSHVAEAYLVQELELAVALICCGLDQIHQPTMHAMQSDHLKLMLLGSGFERLLKAEFCFSHHRDTGKFPSELPWMGKGKGKGHDIVWLLELARSKVDAIPECSNPTITELFKLLTDYGNQDRYFNLNTVQSPGPPRQTFHGGPKSRLTVLIHQQVGLDYTLGLQAIKGIGMTELRTMLNDARQKFAAIVERAAREICRLFRSGQLGELAFEYEHFVSKLAEIHDDDLGTYDCRRW